MAGDRDRIGAILSAVALPAALWPPCARDPWLQLLCGAETPRRRAVDRRLLITEVLVIRARGPRDIDGKALEAMETGGSGREEIVRKAAGDGHAVALDQEME